MTELPCIVCKTYHSEREGCAKMTFTKLKDYAVVFLLMAFLWPLLYTIADDEEML